MPVNVFVTFRPDGPARIPVGDVGNNYANSIVLVESRARKPASHVAQLVLTSLSTLSCTPPLMALSFSLLQIADVNPKKGSNSFVWSAFLDSLIRLSATKTKKIMSKSKIQVMKRGPDGKALFY